MPDNNEAYLKETYYCDYHDPIFQTIPLPSPQSLRAASIEIFRYVRDTLPLSAESLNVKASETMKKKYGACWNKALLMVALLRKHAIPSRIVAHPLKKDFLKPLLGNDVLFINNPYHHCFVQLAIEGSWLYADPSLDKITFEKLYLPLGPAWNIDWDGKSDHIIHTDKILGPPRVIEDIDASFNSGIGNRSTPSFLLPLFNKRYWKKTGWDQVMNQ